MKIGIFNKHRDIREITEDEMKEIIKKVPDVILLDVRSIQEYNEGHMEGSLNIPVYDLENMARRLLKDKEAVIIAYCSAGIRSRKAIKILTKLGYANLYNVREGLYI